MLIIRVAYMSFSINNAPNINSSFASQKSSATSFERLSSGSRINHAGDDAAGLAIAERITTKLDGFDAAIKNSGNAISSIQVADGALSSLSKNIGRIQELAIQSANGSLTDRDRQALQKEATQLIDESNSILSKTNFNGKSLLSSDENTNVQLESAGSNISISGKNLAKEFEDLGFNDIDISRQDSAVAAIDTLKQASEETVGRAAELGAFSNRIESSIDNLSSSRINSAEAKSRITDTDFAKTATDLITSQIQNQVQISLQAQANSQRSTVLKLLS